MGRARSKIQHVNREEGNMIYNNNTSLQLLSKTPFAEHLNFEKLHLISNPIDFLRESRLAGSLDSGLPIVSPIGYKIIKRIEHLIRGIANELGFMEIALPAIMKKELFAKNHLAAQFEGEAIELKEPHDAYMLAATTEEALIEYFGKSIKSYKQLPMRFAHLQNVFRWIKRTQGFYSSRQINFFGFSSFDVNLAAYQESLLLFQELCEKAFAVLQLKYIKNTANDQHQDDLLHTYAKYSPSAFDMVILHMPLTVLSLLKIRILTRVSLRKKLAAAAFALAISSSRLSTDFHSPRSTDSNNSFSSSSGFISKPLCFLCISIPMC